MRSEILKVHRQVTGTTVYVTHDQVEALTMGDRIVVMHEGRIHQVGTPAELYATPVSKFVASFIGTPAMGFLVCDMSRSDGPPVLACGAMQLPLDDAAARALEGGRQGRVWVGIRPKRLSRCPDRCPVGSSLRGTVDVVEMLGAEQHVHVAVEGYSLTARIPREHPGKAGETVTLATEPRHLHLFDHESGDALRAPPWPGAVVPNERSVTAQPSCGRRCRRDFYCSRFCGAGGNFVSAVPRHLPKSGLIGQSDGSLGEDRFMSAFDHRVDPEVREVRRLEVITGALGRRRWSVEAKGRIVAESLAPGVVISEVRAGTISGRSSCSRGATRPGRGALRCRQRRCRSYR